MKNLLSKWPDLRLSTAINKIKSTDKVNKPAMLMKYNSSDCTIYDSFVCLNGGLPDGFFVFVSK